MDANGTLTVPTNASIVNSTDGRNIVVSNIKVDMADGWKGVPYTDDTCSQAADTQVIGLRLRGDAMQEDGSFSLTADKWLIEAGQSLPLQMEAKIPKQTAAGDKGKIATIEYTLELADAHRIRVDWDNGLMLPGSKNVAVFKWATTDANNTLQNVVSDNPDIQLVPIDEQAIIASPAVSRAAVGEQDVLTQAAEPTHTGERAYIVTAKKRGAAHVTGQLITDETASFTVNVSDLPDEQSAQLSENRTEGLGIDLGVKETAILSDNTRYPNLNKSEYVKKLKRRDKRLQRQISRKYKVNNLGLAKTIAG